MRKHALDNGKPALRSTLMALTQNMAIRHKLVLVIMVTCLIALMVAGAAFISFSYAQARREMVKTLQTQAQMIAENCKAAITFDDAADGAEVLAAFHVDPSIVVACIHDTQGNVFATYRRSDTSPALPLPEVKPVEGFRFARDHLAVTKSVRDEEGASVIGTVTVWSDLKQLQTMLGRNALIITGVLVLASLVAYLISAKVQGLISTPILDLTEVAKSISEKKEYSARARKNSNDEVGTLIDSFNEMLGQIQERDRALVGANELLETRVEERTGELKSANKQLTREMDYRKRVEEAQRERTERIIGHQATLLKLGNASDLDLDKAFQMITQEVAQTTDVARVSIWFLEDQRSTLVCEDMYLLDEGIHESGLKRDLAVYPKYAQALEVSRIVAADDALTDVRTRELATGYLDTIGITSLLEVPIRIRGKLVGVICHEHLGPPREWTLEEQDFAASIADMITLKLEVLERKKVQQALRASEHRYRTLLANIPQKIVFKDLDSKYLLANESYARDLNMEAEALCGKSDHDFHPAELADKYVADDKRIMETGVDEEIEDIYRTEGKELIVQKLKSPVRDESGKVIGIFAIFWDITARKAAEESIAQLNLELEANVQELKRSNAELQDFAYVTAHDLKAPLRAIGTLTDWVYADYHDVFEEQGREQMQLVKSRVVRMNELIDSILRYSEIGRGRRNLQTINASRLVADAVSMVDPPEHIDIVIEDPLPLVVCERTRLMQVFQHLIGNGVKYMDKAKGRIEVGCTDEGPHWQFYVSDNGPGISERYHEKIFRMFQTLTPRDELESTGIGLAVVKKIVELFGGNVWLESVEGEGTKFVFTLPKVEDPSEVQEPASSATPV